MRAETVERLALTNDLRRAIDDGELRLVYQPLVPSRPPPRHRGFEALVRWTHPDRGEIPPGRFIPLAEQHGLIEPLGRWVLREALDQLRRWQADGVALDLGMSVNVSRVQLSRPGLADEILERAGRPRAGARPPGGRGDRVGRHGGPRRRQRDARRAARRGVRIALDDFGVGQSSLACLRDLPLDALKLDRGFITSLASAARRPRSCAPSATWRARSASASSPKA